MSEENLNVKTHYDNAFDNLFFNKKFIEAFLGKFKHVPSGLTIDTRFLENSNDPYFVLCCKKYGYEYSPEERVIGDFTINKFNFTEDMLIFCVVYLKENNRSIYNEIVNCKIIY